MRYLPLVLICWLPLTAAEMAAYDSSGRIIALLSPSGDIPVSSNLIAVLPSGKRIPLLSRQEGRGAMRQGDNLAWSANFQLPDGGRGKAEYKSVEDASGVRYSVTVASDSRLEVSSVELVLDLPQKEFLNGTVTANTSFPLSVSRALTPIRYSAETSQLTVSTETLKLNVAFDQPRQTFVVDRWDNFGRSYQIRAVIRPGAWEPGTSASVESKLSFTNTTPAAPVHITLDTAKPGHKFDGFGGNYCWNNQSPISGYTLDNLKLAWGRTEMKAQQWDRQRDKPGPEIQADLATMQRFQRMGVKYVISIWWLPERFYSDPFEKPRSAHFRLIDPLKWDELLDLLGSYLLYAKKEYGVEPDLFSFNEANLGIYVGQTPESHTQAVKRIGAYFQKIGLKTKMLLGDATGPRDTHKFVLDAAADPEAMQYIGAIGFHSWGGGTPEQYTAWGDVGDWLNLPLLVTELGVDAAAYNNHSWDSYQYGLREAQMTQELLIYAHPQGTQYWQFTNDYALARLKDGKVEPLNRFWLMKHFTDLTPHNSEELSAPSDQKNVLVTVFRKDANYTVHILNLGGARTASLERLPDGPWSITQSTESEQFQNKGTLVSNSGILKTELPARSLVTLVAQPTTHGTR